METLISSAALLFTMLVIRSFYVRLFKATARFAVTVAKEVDSRKGRS